MNWKQIIREPAIFLLGVAVGISDLLINYVELGFTEGYTPFWNARISTHWYWDLIWGAFIILVIVIIATQDKEVK